MATIYVLVCSSVFGEDLLIVYSKKTNSILFVTILTGILCTFVSYFTIPLIGLFGGVLSLITYRLFRSILYFRIRFKIRPLQYFEFFGFIYTSLYAFIIILYSLDYFYISYSCLFVLFTSITFHIIKFNNFSFTKFSLLIQNQLLNIISYEKSIKK